MVYAWEWRGGRGELAVQGVVFEVCCRPESDTYVYHLRYPLLPGGREGRESLVGESSSVVVVALGDTRVVMWAGRVESCFSRRSSLKIAVALGTMYTRDCMPRSR